MDAEQALKLLLEATNRGTAESSLNSAAQPSDLGDEGYWFRLVETPIAADYLDLSERTLEGKRATGDGPKFVRISARCVKYRRIDLWEWTEQRLARSTTDVWADSAYEETGLSRAPVPHRHPPFDGPKRYA